MSINYRAIAGYGFFTDVLNTNWTDPRTHERRDHIWGRLPRETREFLGIEYFFEGDFDHETLELILPRDFPDLSFKWVGNPYSHDRSNDGLFVHVKTTLVEEDQGKPVALKDKGFVSARARQALTDVAALFGDDVEPGWFVWHEVS